MASPAGLEPATSGFVNRCSHHLSYGELLHARRRGSVRGGPSGSAPGDPEFRPKIAIAVPRRHHAPCVTKLARRAVRSSNPSSRHLGCCSNRASSPHRSAHRSASPPCSSRCRTTGAWRWRHAMRVALAAAPVDRLAVPSRSRQPLPDRHSSDPARARRHASSCGWKNKKPLETRVSRGSFLPVEACVAGLRCVGGLRRRIECARHRAATEVAGADQRVVIGAVGVHAAIGFLWERRKSRSLQYARETFTSRRPRTIRRHFRASIGRARKMTNGYAPYSALRRM